MERETHGLLFFCFFLFPELLRWKLANEVRQLDPVENAMRV